MKSCVIFKEVEIVKFALKYNNYSKSSVSIHIYIKWTAAVAQWLRALAPQAEGWVFESKPRQTQVVSTGSDSSTAKRSAIGAMGPRSVPL